MGELGRPRRRRRAHTRVSRKLEVAEVETACEAQKQPPDLAAAAQLAAHRATMLCCGAGGSSDNKVHDFTPEGSPSKKYEETPHPLDKSRASATNVYASMLTSCLLYTSPSPRD